MTKTGSHTWLIITTLLCTSLMSTGQGLLLTAGSKLVVNGNAQIVIKDGGIINNGNFTAGNGSVNFTGNTQTGNSSISGSSVTAFFDLVLNKTSNGIRLNNNINVTNRLSFISGDSFFLNNYNIDLGNTGVLFGERNNSRVTGLTGGYIQRTQIINAGSVLSPGNLGIEITSSAALGNTMIRRGHKKMINMPAGAVSRYYDVISANNSGLDATVKFNYLDGETGGLPENNLVLYSSSCAGVTWDFLGLSTADMTQNFVTKNDLDKLNLFIIADLGSILPVHLIYFNAKLVNRQTLLNWSVADESDVDRYEIERSADGIHFNSLFTVNKKGMNQGTENYESIDKDPVNGFNYYRLKIVDKSHHYKYSKIVQVYLGTGSNMEISIYPNPAQQIIKLVYISEKNDQVQATIFDAGGRMISSNKLTVSGGRNEIPFDIHVLPAGTYFVQVLGNISKTLQFIKQ
jgi:hypothetical protein